MTVVAGGSKTVNQISIIYPNRLVRVASMPFALKYATCTYNQTAAFLCFPGSARKTCWITTDLKYFENTAEFPWDVHGGGTNIVYFHQALTAYTNDRQIVQLIDHSWRIRDDIPLFPKDRGYDKNISTFVNISASFGAIHVILVQRK